MASDIVLGFDYGTKYIGIAVGNRIAGTARPLTAVAGGDPPDWAAIERTVANWQPDCLLVGLPLNDNNEGRQREQPMTRRARRFMNELEARFPLTVEAVDERYTTAEAVTRLAEARATGSRGRRVAKADRDAAAAGVIVEAWLAEQTSSTPHQ